MSIHPAFISVASDPSRLELVLRLEDGSPWRLTVSAGVERFVGYYPRLDGFDTGGPLVTFGATKPA